MTRTTNLNNPNCHMSLAGASRGNDNDIFPSKTSISQLFLVVPQTKGFTLNFLFLPSLWGVHICIAVVGACRLLWKKNLQWVVCVCVCVGGGVLLLNSIKKYNDATFCNYLCLSISLAPPPSPPSHSIQNNLKISQNNCSSMYPSH